MDGKANMPYNIAGADLSMTRLTITAKGQVTLKRELLRHLGAAPGDRIEIDKLSDGQIVVRAAAQDGTISDFIGCLAQKKGPKFTIEEMNDITARAWAKAK
jgi:antitoxin PrlF